jgi:hypothetical protein
MSGPLRLACTCLLAGALTGAWAQTGIYTCVDGKGRHITSDRPVAECADREQKQLNPSGTVRRVVPPVPTATERAAQEVQEHQLAEERQRQAEQKRLEKLLVGRYPNQAAHDADRVQALQNVEGAVASGRRRVAELIAERRKLQDEAQGYRDPAKLPATLKQRLDDNQQQIAAQERFIAAQDEEKKRIAAHYDQELARLKQLWAQQTAVR